MPLDTFPSPAGTHLAHMSLAEYLDTSARNFLRLLTLPVGGISSKALALPFTGMSC